jgi:hypothetical protein
MWISRESLQVFLCARRRGVLGGFTARRQTWRNMAWTGNKEVLCFGICHNCDGATEVSDHVPHRTTYGKNSSWVVHEIQAEWLPVRCETKRPAGAIGRDCRGVRETFVRCSICHQGHDRNLECLSLCWHATLRRDHPGYCTAEVGNPGGSYELPCIRNMHLSYVLFA